MSEVWKCPWCGGEMTEAHTFCEDAVRDEADRISALEAALAKADELDAISEMLLRMMDDVLRPTGKGDMAIVPDGSVGVISAWKTLTAYRQARDATT